jgi:hypothetical protein
MKLLKQTPACPFTPVAAGTMTLFAVPWRQGIRAENLMPYEAAAKAIFVKANGLPAYHKATGTFRYAVASRPERNKKSHV